GRGRGGPRRSTRRPGRGGTRPAAAAARDRAVPAGPHRVAGRGVRRPRVRHRRPGRRRGRRRPPAVGDGRLRAPLPAGRLPAGPLRPGPVPAGRLPAGPLPAGPVRPVRLRRLAGAARVRPVVVRAAGLRPGVRAGLRHAVRPAAAEPPARHGPSASRRESAVNRPTLSLIAVATALAAVTGFAALSAPEPGEDTAGAAAARLPVERTSLVCPAPSTSDLAETTYTSFTPATDGADGKGAAALHAVDGKAPDDGKADEDGKQDGGTD